MYSKTRLLSKYVPAAAVAAMRYIPSRLASRSQSNVPGSHTSGAQVISSRPTKTSKYGKRNSFKKKLMNAKGAKHHTIDLAPNLLHNRYYYFCPTYGIDQGSGNTQRDGDDIYLCAFKVNMSISAPTTAGAYQYRFILGYHRDEISTLASSSWIEMDGTAGKIAPSIFLPSTGGSLTTTGIIDPKRFTVVDDRIVDVNSLLADIRDIKHVSYTVPLNQNFIYRGDTSVFGKVRQLYFVCIPVVLGGTPAVTSCGSVFCSTDLVFKDV